MSQEELAFVYSKMPGIGQSIFSKMSALAAQTNAINLSQGFPDFPIDKDLIECVHKAMMDGANQYAPMPGNLGLREKIAEYLLPPNALLKNPNDHITITSGATQGLSTAISAFVKEGDEVIVFEPVYDSYVPIIKLNGGNPITIELEAPHFQIDIEQLKSRISQKTKMIVINNPHNPTGALVPKSTWENLANLIADKDILLLSDEVYQYHVFDKLQYFSPLEHESLAPKCISVYSFGKMFHTTGWKLGYCVASEKLTQEIRRLHQFQVFSVHSASQRALESYIPLEKHETVSAFFQKKRDLFRSALKESRFKLLPCQGTYFQSLSYEDFDDWQEWGDQNVAELLAKNFGVASIPYSSFYSKDADKGILRFCFAKQDHTLKKAAQLLCKI